MKANLLHGFYLRDLFVDPVKGEVTGRAGSVHLPPKAMEVLLCLASNPGELVTREALIAEVWGADHGSSLALNHAVSEIRHALDDYAAEAALIQTLPKRGYRLIVEVVPADTGTASIVIGMKNGADVGDIGLFENLKHRGVLETGIAYLVLGWLLIQVAANVFEQLHLPSWAGTFVTVFVIAGFPVALILSWFLEFRDGRAVLDTKGPRDERRRRFSRTYLSVIGGLAIAAIGVFLYDRNAGLPTAAPPDTDAQLEAILPPVADNSIAVLPFFNIDGSDNTQLFSNGLADDLITRLSRVPGLLVSSRGDSFSLTANSTSTRVRERLRVALYVEGSVEIAGDHLRVIMQLIDSATGFHVVAKTYDRSIEGYFDIRDEITELTVANIRVALPPETQQIPIADFEHTDLNAYVLYRRGKELLERPRTLESLAQVTNYYEQALAIDSRYAAAHAGLCEAHVARFELSNESEDIEMAEQACKTALASNSRLNMVYVALGDLYRRTGRTADGEEAYQRALDIQPQDTGAMTGLARIYRRQQKYERAEALLLHATSMRPGNWRLINEIGSFYWIVGRYADAAEAFRRVVFFDAANYQARTNLGAALYMAGDFEAGKRVLIEALAIEPSNTAYSNLGVVYYYLGQFDEAVANHRQAVRMAPGDALNWLNLADAQHFLGMQQESREMFRRAEEIAANRLAVDPLDSEAIAVRAWARYMLGDSQAAREGIDRAVSVAPSDPFGFYYDGLIRTQLGDHRGAVDALKQAIELGYPTSLLAAEPYLEALRANKEFRALLEGAE